MLLSVLQEIGVSYRVDFDLTTTNMMTVPFLFTCLEEGGGGGGEGRPSAAMVVWWAVGQG